jgi:succinate dehydrogenase/fumarate reductase flavoprotein subunit
VRGTGGIALAGDGCETSVPGLYAAGDAATRELVTGSRSGGGSHNGAWAMSSGTIAGGAAAKFARRRASAGAVADVASLRGAARAGVPSAGAGAADESVSPDEVIASVQAEVLTPGKCMFRTAASLNESLAQLDSLWSEQVPRLGLHRGRQKAREAAAMAAHARWMYRSALARDESRGVHRRLDRPETDPAQTIRLRTGGLDTIWVRPEPLSLPGSRPPQTPQENMRAAS